MEYEVIRSKQFTKEYSKLKMSGNKKLKEKTDEVIVNLQNKIFTPSMQIHQLKNEMRGWWDAHISGNYVVIYKYNENTHQLIVDKLGNHSTTNIESYNDGYTVEEYNLLKELY